MAKITYVQPDDRAQTFDVPAGHSVMEGAFKNNVEGIIAECGGACACGTCQVLVGRTHCARAPEAALSAHTQERSLTSR
jgi:2Fe-2S ferredoxin